MIKIRDDILSYREPKEILKEIEVVTKEINYS